MKRFFTKKIIFAILLSLAHCGGPNMFEREASLGESDGFQNGTADLTVSDESTTHSYPGIRTNVHYDDVDDSLEITIFGEDESSTYECILFLLIPNATTLANGNAVSINSETLYGSMSYGTASDDTDTSANFTNLIDGELEIDQICLDSEDCTNVASYTVTFTQNGTTMTVEGDYESDYLSLD